MKMTFLYPHIKWAFNVNNWIPTFEQWKLAVQCVQKEETERCYRFVFVEDCKSSMVGRLLMRKAVSEGIGQPYDKIIFSRSSSGKPYIEENNKFSFNVSHHGDFCVLAAEQDLNVGIDVMKVEYKGKKPLSEYFSIMKRQFSSYEWDFISQPGVEKEQLKRFFRLWCLKESYVKAIGTGIAFDLASLSFACPTPMLQRDLITTDTKLYKEGQLLSEWKFEETFLDDDHCVAVATYPITQPSIDHLNFDNNLNCFELLAFGDLVGDCKPFETEEEGFWEAFQSKCIKLKS